jgi:RNA polymerase sigma-70 factor (ECF subfamily)
MFTNFGREDLVPTQSYNFQQIHEAYRSRITRYLAGLVGADKAEDLCQEVFVKVNKGLKDFRAEAKLSTWIYRIATNTYHDHVRGRTFKQQQKEQLTPAEEIDALKDEVPGIGEQSPVVEQQMIRGEMIECIRGYIDQLPEDYRVVLLLSEEEGFKNREIAEVLKISLDNVKIRLHRANAKLKELLEGNCEFYLDERSEVACDRKQSCD